jgi:pimeloyl-ACP methyl ester carboxylesterase
MRRVLVVSSFSARGDWNEEKKMERRSFLGALTAASVEVALEGSFAEFGRAQNASPVVASLPGRAAKKGEFPQNSTVILVHGAWADGYCWSNIVLPLERRGLKVICAPIPLTSLTNDATALSWALERTSGPVVLVGHAYSGAVIAAVREDQVKSLVYIAALAPDEGETVSTVFYRDAPHPEAPKLAPDSHGFIWMPEDRFRLAVAHKASADQTNIAAAVQRPDCGSVHSRAGASAALEIKTVVVFDRRGRPHDQSENSAFHGGSDGCNCSVASCGPHAHVHGS